MTRKELASEIYELNSKRGLAGQSSKEAYVHNLLNGCGYAKRMNKAELQAWRDRLVAEA